MVLLDFGVDDITEVTAAVLFDSTASTVGGDFGEEMVLPFVGRAFG